MRTAHVVLMLGLLAAAREGFALEGKWTPDQVLELDAHWLAAQGLELPPDRLWGHDGAGLLEAAVGIEGCSAGFISADGLMITNHHCAFSILQQHATKERDLITDGFLAAERAQELPGGGVRATIPHRSTDVTAEVLAAIPAGADDLARYRAIERKGKELVATCERQPKRRCRFAIFDGGVRYLLIEGIEYPDVRLVYAPPLSIGNYGGEIDNWSWPRHTGDFALLRVWADDSGQPAEKGKGTIAYRPRHFFPVAKAGLEAGDFVMVAGYPGTTYRALTAAEMSERAELWFPHRASLFSDWIEIMATASRQSEEARLALADRMKSFANNEKNARGQVAGIARGRLLDKKREEERQVLAWIEQHGEHRPAAAAHAELAALMAEEARTWERDFLLGRLRTDERPIDLASILVRWAAEREKPDLERNPEFMERNRSRLLERLKLAQKQMHPMTEEILLADYLARFAALPAESRSPAIEALLGTEAGAREARPIRAKAAALLANSKVADAAERETMANETVAQLRARRDPLLELAFALDRELEELRERGDRHQGAVARLRPVWRQAVAAWSGAPIAPDANGTLRVTFAHVQGYAPRDGIWMKPQTTLSGVVEKATGKEPFAAPAKLLEAAPGAAASRFADPLLKDVPVAFLADADTTGGNSGSPVVNGRGELVGVNFDRVWENVANDFGFNPEVARNVTADVRYLLWMLETLSGEVARPLLAEMGVEATGTTDAEAGAGSAPDANP